MAPENAPPRTDAEELARDLERIARDLNRVVIAVYALVGAVVATPVALAYLCG